ncbi:hypothetical protein M2133_002616 [Parabacteroides sp. PF5-6]|nr:hypothetical protein [Parabacteroides sp. PF5-6]
MTYKLALTNNGLQAQKLLRPAKDKIAYAYEKRKK